MFNRGFAEDERSLPRLSCWTGHPSGVQPG